MRIFMEWNVLGFWWLRAAEPNTSFLSFFVWIWNLQQLREYQKIRENCFVSQQYVTPNLIVQRLPSSVHVRVSFLGIMYPRHYKVCLCCFHKQQGVNFCTLIVYFITSHTSLPNIWGVVCPLLEDTLCSCLHPVTPSPVAGVPRTTETAESSLCCRTAFVLHLDFLLLLPSHQESLPLTSQAIASLFFTLPLFMPHTRISRAPPAWSFF